LVVLDQIIGNFVSAVARFHFHPDILVAQTDEFNWVLNLPDKQQIFIKVLKGRGLIDDSWHSPEFGKRIKSSCLEINFGIEENIGLEISW